MNYSGTGRRRVAPWKGIAAVIAAGVLGLAAAPMATADDFEPGNTAPTVTGVNGDLGATIQPDQDIGETTYLIVSTVGDVDSLQDLVGGGGNVVMCLYRDGGDSECDTTDEQTAMAITWSGNDTFTVTEGSGAHFSDGGSTDNYVATNTGMSLVWRFKVSEAMQEAADWNVRVTATDNSDAEGFNEDATLEVLHYSSLDVGRAPVSFGTINSGFSIAQEAIAATVMSNGGYDLNMVAAQTYMLGGTSNTEAAFDTQTPGDALSATEVALDCVGTVGGSVYSDTNALRVTNTGADIPNRTGLVPGVGLAEDGVSAETACQLENGGQLPVENYSQTVTFTVTAD